MVEIPNIKSENLRALIYYTAIIILLFADGVLISKVKTSYYGPEETGARAASKGPVKSGFIFKIPKKLLPTTQDIRIFAFSKSGAASELEYREADK